MSNILLYVCQLFQCILFLYIKKILFLTAHGIAKLNIFQQLTNALKLLLYKLFTRVSSAMVLYKD